MFRLGTMSNVADNSGAKVVQCLKILKGSSKVGKIGDTIVISVKTVRSATSSQKRSTKGIHKGSVQKALIVRTRKEYIQKDGTCIRFGENAVTLLKKQGQSAGTRLFGPILEDLRIVKDMRLLSLASYII